MFMWLWGIHGSKGIVALGLLAGLVGNYCSLWANMEVKNLLTLTHDISLKDFFTAHSHLNQSPLCYFCGMTLGLTQVQPTVITSVPSLKSYFALLSPFLLCLRLGTLEWDGKNKEDWIHTGTDEARCKVPTHLMMLSTWRLKINELLQHWHTWCITSQCHENDGSCSCRQNDWLQDGNIMV